MIASCGLSAMKRHQVAEGNPSKIIWSNLVIHSFETASLQNSPQIALAPPILSSSMMLVDYLGCPSKAFLYVASWKKSHKACKPLRTPQPVAVALGLGLDINFPQLSLSSSFIIQMIILNGPSHDLCQAFSILDVLFVTCFTSETLKYLDFFKAT